MGEKKPSNITRLLHLLTGAKKNIGFIFVCLVVTTATTFLRPLVIRGITDDGMVGKNFDLILQFGLLFLALAVVEIVFELLQSRLFVVLQNNIQFTLYKKAFGKLQHLRSGYFSDKNSAEIINQILTDISSTSGVADRGMLFMVTFILTIIGGLVGLFIINWKMALLVIAIVPVKYLMARVLARRQEQITTQYINHSNSFSSWFSDIISGIKEIKLWNLSGKKANEFIEKQKELLDDNKAITMIEAYNTSFNSFMTWLLTSILYILGGFLLIQGDITLGGVIAFISYSSYVTGPIGSLLNIRMLLAQMRPSMNRLFEFFDMEEEENYGRLEASQFTSLDLQHVSFSYREGYELLRDIDLTISRGDKVAIIGPNGSGKSTIINLLLRFLEPANGSIFLNGEDSASYELASYRQMFSVVSQSPYLFQDSVLNNIVMFSDFKNDQVARACKNSGVGSFIPRLEDGIDSVVGNDGAKLSGGEKQKIAVARTILKNAPIVFLDEATSNYDVESSIFLNEFIMNECRDKTVIMITHNYSNLNGFERIYRLKNGMLHSVAAGEVDGVSF